MVCGNKIVSEQHKCWNEFRYQQFHVNNICHWFKQFQEAGSVCKRKSFRRPAVKEVNVERIWQSFILSPCKSIPWHNLELDIPKSPVHRILHMKLELHVYKIQLPHEIRTADKPKGNEPAEHTLEKIDSPVLCITLCLLMRLFSI